jgi:fibronectin type 3 domain-containing protein
MSKRSSILLALPLALFVAGCGSDSPTNVNPVDTVPPIAVLDLDATTVTSTSVQLAWVANTEADLAGYRVYRGVGNGVTTLVGVETAPGYRDGNVTSGNSYRYLVCAFDTAGNESPRHAIWVSIGSGGTGRDGIE